MVSQLKKDLPYRYKALADVLPVGQEKAIKLDNIMKMAGIKDRRNAYEIIELLIIKYGYTILANRKGDNLGYFIPKDEEEFNECIRSFRQTVTSMNERHTALVNNFYRNSIGVRQVSGNE